MSQQGVARRHWLLLSALLIASINTQTFGQGIAGSESRQLQAQRAAAQPELAAVIGKWTYRSFVSDPDLNAEPNTLLFGSGTMSLSATAPDDLSGTLGGSGWQLALTGKVVSGTPISIRFQGKGTINGEEWVYDYLGYVVPPWPSGVSQRPAIVGTIIRTVPHSGGAATAGYVAQWIAVRQDEEPQPPSNAQSLSISPAASSEFETIERDWARAVESNDPTRIGAYFTEDFVFVGAAGVAQDRSQHLDDFRSGRLKLETVGVQSLIIHAYDGFAVVNALVSVKGRFGELDISGDYRFMDTFRRAANGWLAVARQQTRVMASASAVPDTLAPNAAAVQQRLNGVKAQLELERFNQLKILSAASPEFDAQLPASERLSLARAATGELPNPPLAMPGADGKILLEAKFADNVLGVTSPVTLHLRSYNGGLVGPTIRAKAGETVKIRLVNNLPPEPGPVPHGDGHHGWNTTNLHTHGLHVKPQANPNGTGPAPIESDNVLIEIPPGATQEYAFEIPANHPAGTFWYHAHKHGSTSAQVSSGMAGALIVSRDGTEEHLGNLDLVPNIHDAMAVVNRREREKILVLQQMPFVMRQNKGVIEREDADTSFAPVGAGSWHQSGHSTTVNGKLLPVITFMPGEVQRWRMIHSGFRELLKLQIEKDPDPAIGGSGPDHILLHQVALDGLPLSKRDPLQEVELFPGYRSDVLVQAPVQSGVYYLIDATSPAGNSLFGESEPLKFIAKIVIGDGAPLSMGLPTNEQIAVHRLASLTAPPTGDPVERAYYGITAAGFVIGNVDPGPTHPVAGAPFSTASTRLLTLGKSQRWLIGTRNDPGIRVAHPFHIHVNPFEIVAIRTPDGTNILPEPIWRDTIAMPQGQTIEFLTKYEDFEGSFVQHCHILDHEDRGMMQKITIAASPTPTPPVAAESPSGPALLNAPQGDRSRPSVLLFVKGANCPNCMSQLHAMATSLVDKQVDVTVVTASSAEDIKAFPNTPFRIIADPALQLFKQNGVFDGAAQHATIVRDAQGTVRHKSVGDEPLMDSSVVLAALALAEPSYVIAVRGTDDPGDDYLTWSPTPCTIRMVNGLPGSPPVTVTLTNDDPTANPTGGELRFATTLAPNSTATSTAITLLLDPDGTPQNFYVAGYKPSTLTSASLANGGRDTKIVIHQGSEAGARLGEHAVMVRVRKAIRDSADPLPKANDLELMELLKALRDLHLIDNRLEWYVRLHRLATLHGALWRDQAHKSSAFIAWHRAFLLQFERELQVRYPHVALLYWVQGTQEQFFSESRYGTSPATGDVVEFSTASPLHNWALSLPSDPGDGTTAMGPLRRRPIDHNDPDAPNLAFGDVYDQWPNFLGIANRDRFSAFRTAVENNPHNIGHGTVGPFGVWMSNCRESNADPVFYVFHCNHDYLWAKWQYTFDRFVNDGSDAKYYSPPDAFTDASADKTIPLGHHLKDKMWPWDGTTGQVVAGQPGSNRPNVNGFGPFPQSTVAILWPPGSAEPRPQDMIDYAGYLDRANDLGFCYDDVPFGAPSTPLVPLLAAAQPPEAERLSRAVIADRAANADTRMMALRSLPSDGGGISPESVTALSTVVGDATQAPDLRAAALSKLSAHAPVEAFRSSLPLLRDVQAPLSIRLAALNNATQQVHFSEIPHDETHRIFDELRGILTQDAPAPLKAAAVRALAPRGDSAAKPILLASLPPEQGTAIPLQEAVALLRFFPDQKERLQSFISSHLDEVAVAAIQALYDDAGSVDTRKALARDRQRSFAARQAAVQSLAHDAAPDLTEFLTLIAGDESDELKLREEALASASVRLRKNFRQFSDNDKQAWQTRLEAILAAESSELGRLRREAIEIVSAKP